MALSSQTTTQYRVNSPSSYRSRSTFPCSEVGCYSIDKDGTLHNNDRRELRRLKTNYKQLVGSELSGDFTRSEGDYFFNNIERPFDALLYWTVKNKDKLLKEGETGGNKPRKRLVDDDDLISASIYLAINVAGTGRVRVLHLLATPNFCKQPQIENPGTNKKTLLVSQGLIHCNCTIYFCCAHPRFAEFTDFSCRTSAF